MEIKNEPSIQGLSSSGISGKAASQGGVKEPQDTFTQSSRQSKKVKPFMQLTQNGVASVVLKKEKKEPVPLAQAAHWKYEAEDNYSIDDVTPTPAGTTFISCHSFDSRNRSGSRAYVAAFDSGGNEMWKYRAEKKHSIEGHAFLSDGTSYLVCNSEERWDKSYIVALNPDGTEKWKFTPDTEAQCSSIQVGPDGTLYAKMDNELYAIDTNGAMKYRHRITIHSDDYFHEVAPDGTNILANDNFSNNFGYDTFYGISAQGRKKELEFPDIGTFPLRDTKGHLFYGGEKNEFYGIDLQTGQKWEIELDAPRGTKTPHFGKDGTIYAEGRYDNNTLYAIDPKGKLLWKQVIDDHRAPGMGLDSYYKVAKDGSVFYGLEDRDAIQQIDASGNRVRQIEIPGGFSEFVPDNRGNLYVRDYNGTIIFLTIETDQRFYFPMEIAQNIDMKEVLDDGTLVFQGMCERYHVRLDKDDEVKKIIEEAQKEGEEAEKDPDEIVVDDNWVIIGNVKIPRQ